MLNNNPYKLKRLLFPLIFLTTSLDAEALRQTSKDNIANDIMFLEPDPVTIKNKLRYLHQLSHVSPLIKRVEKSSCQNAESLLKSAVDSHAKAQQELEQENLQSALEYADQGLRAMAVVARILPNKVREKKANKDRYNQLHTHVLGLKKTLSRIEVDAVKAPRTDLDELIAKAEQLSQAGDDHLAGDHLAQVAVELETALNDAYETDTLVYELGFNTPEEEYQYEDKRNKEYISLAEILQQQGAFSEERVVVINETKAKNAAMRSEAEVLANSGRFELAIKKMEDASRILTNVLRSAGLAVQ